MDARGRRTSGLLQIKSRAASPCVNKMPPERGHFTRCGCVRRSPLRWRRAQPSATLTEDMRIDLDHLPATKRRELERVVQILFEEFEEAQSGATADGRRRGRIGKIVLYGSYARGGWVDEPHTAKGYQSDFDLLVIVNDKEAADGRLWERAEERFNAERTIGGGLRTPVNFIVHTLQEVNDGLAHGRYFFMDIARDGIALYQSDDSELHRPRPKSPEEALAAAEEYYEEWFPSACALKDGAEFYISRGRLKEAAFSLHQATERLYHCVLLVCTFYTPHVHNLGFLRTQAERLDVRLVHPWPRQSRSERARFEKLKAAYVKARYSRHYRISTDELAWLVERVEELGRAVHDVCFKRLEALRNRNP